MTARKTSRTYGAILSSVRIEAQKLKRFTIAELHSLHGKQADNACRKLVERGELKVAQNGRPGSWGGITRRIYTTL